MQPLRGVRQQSGRAIHLRSLWVQCRGEDQHRGKRAEAGAGGEDCERKRINKELSGNNLCKSMQVVGIFSGYKEMKSHKLFRDSS